MVDRPVCRNPHCDAPGPLDRFGQCDACGGYHREFDTGRYTPWRDEQARQAEEDRRAQVNSLRECLRQHVGAMGERWPGCEFGKAHVGEMFLRALADLGCDRREELQAAIEKSTVRLGSAPK